MMLNGTMDESFQKIDNPEIVGIEIDTVNQVLYWTNLNTGTLGKIKRLDLNTVSLHHVHSARTHTHTHTHTDTHTHTLVHSHTHTHTLVHSHTHTHTDTHARIFAAGI